MVKDKTLETFLSLGWLLWDVPQTGRCRHSLFSVAGDHPQLHSNSVPKVPFTAGAYESILQVGKQVREIRQLIKVSQLRHEPHIQTQAT